MESLTEPRKLFTLTHLIAIFFSAQSKSFLWEAKFFWLQAVAKTSACESAGLKTPRWSQGSPPSGYSLRMRNAMGGKKVSIRMSGWLQSCTKLVNAWGERAVWSIGRGLETRKCACQGTCQGKPWGQSPGVENKEDTRSDQWTVKVRSGKSL